MKVITSLMAVFCLNLLLSQTYFAPDGANWNFHYIGHSGGFESDWSIKVTKDSIVDGYPTRFLERTFLVTYSLPPNLPTGSVEEVNYGLLQERNDSVFYYYEGAYPNNGRYLYSFIMNIGDTIVIDPSYPDLIAVVDTVFDTIVDGNTVSRWDLTKYCIEFGVPNEFGTTQIIDDIGPIDDFLLWNTDGCPIGGGWWIFECYASSSLNYNIPCNPLHLGIEPNKKVEVEIYPSPASEMITIKTSSNHNNCTIQVIDATGTQVYFIENISTNLIEIPVLDFNPGLYTIVLNHETGILRRRIPVIH